MYAVVVSGLETPGQDQVDMMGAVMLLLNYGVNGCSLLFLRYVFEVLETLYTAIRKCFAKEYWSSAYFFLGVHILFKFLSI